MSPIINAGLSREWQAWETVVNDNQRVIISIALFLTLFGVERARERRSKELRALLALKRWGRVIRKLKRLGKPW